MYSERIYEIINPVSIYNADLLILLAKINLDN